MLIRSGCPWVRLMSGTNELRVPGVKKGGALVGEHGTVLAAGRMSTAKCVECFRKYHASECSFGYSESRAELLFATVSLLIIIRILLMLLLDYVIE